MVRNWIVVIQGFRQKVGSRDGMERLWRDSLREHSSESTQVDIKPWHSDWVQYAGHIASCSPNGQPRRVIVAAYSWGAGYGFRQLAKALFSHGIGVSHAMLCDPVFHAGPLLPRQLVPAPLQRLNWWSWLALTPWGVIRIPSNVCRVSWFYQRQNRPWGRLPVADDPQATVIEPGCELRCAHEHCDDQAEWHRLSESICNTTLSKEGESHAT